VADLNSSFLSRSDLEEIGFRRLGDNVLLHRSCVVVGASNISIDDNVRVDPFSTLIASSGELSIGKYVHIASSVHLSASYGIFLGDFVSLSHGVKVFSVTDDFSGEHLTGPVVPPHLVRPHAAPVRIDRHAVIGAGTVILPGVTVGTGAVVGALSLVKVSVREWTIVAGIPTTFRRHRSQALLRDERELVRFEGSPKNG
jgi:galactoside O-acetyltransferase